MAYDKAVTIRLRGDNTHFRRTLGQTDGVARQWGQKMATFRGNVVSSFASLGSSLPGGGLLAGVISTRALATLGAAGVAVGGVVATAVAGGKAISAAWDMEALIMGLKAASDGVRPLHEQMQILARTAAGPGLALEPLIEAVTMMEMSGMGFDQSVRTIKELGNALAYTGGSAADLRNVTDALKDMLATGTIEDAKMDRIVEAAPKVGQALQDAFGANTAVGLRAKGLDPASMVAGLVAQLEKLDRAPMGGAAKLEKLKESVANMWAAVGAKGSGLASELVKNTQEAVNTLNSWLGLDKAPAQMVPESDADRQKAKDAAAERERKMQEAARLAEVERQKRIANAYRELQLKEQIAKIEAVGGEATELKVMLALLTQMEAVKKSMNMNDKEAAAFIRQTVQAEQRIADLLQRGRAC